MAFFEKTSYRRRPKIGIFFYAKRPGTSGLIHGVRRVFENGEIRMECMFRSSQTPPQVNQQKRGLHMPHIPLKQRLEADRRRLEILYVEKDIERSLCVSRHLDRLVRYVFLIRNGPFSRAPWSRPCKKRGLRL
jgi:hypothetical protein